MQANGQVFKRNDLGSGLSLPESFASYDHDTSSWRTSGLSLFGGWMQYSESFPRAGMMRNGNVYQLPPLVPRTSGTGSGSWPTPMSRDWKGLTRALNEKGQSGDKSGQIYRGTWGASLPDAVNRWPTPTGRDWKGPGQGRIRNGKLQTDTLDRAVQHRTGTGQLNPTWVEWLMGYPSGWTDLKDSETL